jgi:hypothetical protein
VTLFLQIAGLALVLAGGLIALINGWLFVNQLIGRRGSSVAPVVGGLFLLSGGLLYPDPEVRKWAWVGLLIDYGCVPYILLASYSVWSDSRKYSAERKLLELAVETPQLVGAVVVFPDNVAFLEYTCKDGTRQGSIQLKAMHDSPIGEIELTNLELRIRLARLDGGWKVLEERGWKEDKMSLLNASVQERPLARSRPGG